METHLSEIVRYHRKQSGLSRQKLADLAGVGKTVIYDVENGKDSVGFSTLKKILDALNVKIIYDSPLMERFNEESGNSL